MGAILPGWNVFFSPAGYVVILFGGERSNISHQSIFLA